MSDNTKNIIAKINRRCRKQGIERLCTTPERHGFTPNGDHYVIDTTTREVVRTHVDVEELACQLGIDSRSKVDKVVDDARAYARVFGGETWSGYLQKLDARLDCLAVAS